MIDDEEYRKWLESRPPKVAAVIRKFPPLVCYRGRGRDAHSHYVIYAYDEEKEGGRVTLRLLHGADSFLPGHLVFGVPTGQVEACGCGKWKEATEEQANQAQLMAQAMAKNNPFIQARRRRC